MRLGHCHSGRRFEAEENHRLLSKIKKQFGKVDVLENNIGTYEFAPLESITPEHIQKHFNLNVTGLLLTTKEAVKLMGPDVCPGNGFPLDLGGVEKS